MSKFDLTSKKKVILSKRQIFQDAERMEKFGTLEKQFKGRGVKPSGSAKAIAKNIKPFRDRRITALEIQHLINRFEARGIDYQYFDFNVKFDISLTVEEAKEELMRDSEFFS